MRTVTTNRFRHSQSVFQVLELMPVSDTARICRARYHHFPNDPARVIHNADAGLLDRYVQSSKMVLLLFSF